MFGGDVTMFYTYVISIRTFLYIMLLYYYTTTIIIIIIIIILLYNIILTFLYIRFPVIPVFNELVLK